MGKITKQHRSGSKKSEDLQLYLVFVGILTIFVGVWIGWPWNESRPTKTQASRHSRLAKASNVAMWTGNAQNDLRQIWEAEGVEERRMSWDNLWHAMPQYKDWYNKEDEFLQQLLPRLPNGAHCLQLGVGRNSLAASVLNAGKIQSLLNIDIATEVVAEQQLKHAVEINQREIQFDFKAADVLNLKFSDLNQAGWPRFNVVFEKAGLFDVYRRSTGLIQRQLACIITEAFEPSLGGRIVALVTQDVNEHPQKCKHCTSPGLVEAVSIRPDFNCTTTEEFPLEQPSWLQSKPSKSLIFVVVECGGVSLKQAEAGCEAVWLQDS